MDNYSNSRSVINYVSYVCCVRFLRSMTMRLLRIFLRALRWMETPLSVGLRYFDLVWICRTTCCTTNPQLIEVVECDTEDCCVRLLIARTPSLCLDLRLRVRSICINSVRVASVRLLHACLAASYYWPCSNIVRSGP